jgi:hypothetical protein
VTPGTPPEFDVTLEQLCDRFMQGTSNVDLRKWRFFQPALAALAVLSPTPILGWNGMLIERASRFLGELF